MHWSTGPPLSPRRDGGPWSERLLRFRGLRARGCTVAAAGDLLSALDHRCQVFEAGGSNHAVDFATIGQRDKRGDFGYLKLSG